MTPKRLVLTMLSNPTKVNTGTSMTRKMIQKLRLNELAPSQRKETAAAVYGYDLFMASRAGVWADSVSKMSENLTYRVSTAADGVDVICFGLENVDSNIDGHYDTPNDLPSWIQERLAVLMITSPSPPTKEVAGIGRRISRDVFWVYPPTTVS